MEAKKTKKQAEKIEILDESTGQIRVKYVKDQNDFDFSLFSQKESKTIDQTQFETDYERELATEYELISNQQTNRKKSVIDYSDMNNQAQLIQILEDNSNHSPPEVPNQVETFQNLHTQANSQALKQQNLMNSGLSAHIVQNYSILAQEITAPLDHKSNHLAIDSVQSSANDFIAKQWISNPTTNQNSKATKTLNSYTTNSGQQRSSKDSATCQFCGLAMLKKNIPTHIRRAHTPKEELVCLNEEQNIFTFNYLKPGQRRKRSARAYDYSLMTATVSIDEDPCDGIENKFITEGEEILSTDLNQLADRIKYGITQIPISTLNKLIDILAKIEYSTQDEVCANAKSIRNMICYYLESGEEFKYKIRQVSDDIVEKKKQVGNLRADLKEVMTRKAQLERRIQPLVCDLQKLEDQHGSLIESIVQMNNLIQCDILQPHEDSAIN